LPRIFAQVGTPGSYRYYKLNVVTNNGSANERMEIGQLRMFTFDAPGTAVGADYTSNYGDLCRHTSSSLEARSVYGSIDKNGATFYLDPAQWLPGAYDVRVKRGYSNAMSNMTWPNYSNGIGAAFTDHFDYRTSSGVHLINIGQRDMRSDTQLEVFSSVSYDVPVDTTGIACIALELKNTVVDSISAEFTRYAPVYSGGVWTDAEAPTQNPAALYRALLLGAAHPNPPPGEIINEDELATWYTRCVANAR